MRLPSTLLVVAALTLLASGSAHADTTKVSTLASPDLDVLAVSHNAGDEKRFLRGLKSVDEADEERLAGANMFNVEKLEKAMGDRLYAQTLMKRWKRHGYDITNLKEKLNKSNLVGSPRLNDLYHTYAAWFNTLDDKIAAADKALFVKADLDNAVKDSSAAKTLFRQWKTGNFESNDVFKKLETLGLKTGDDAYDKLYKNYMSWLNVHYPDKATKALARQSHLFSESMLFDAMKDVTYRESLFRAWKTKGYSKKRVDEMLGNTAAGGGGGLNKEYNTWLQTHFPPKARTTRS
ncbi:hypothetical protein PR003_g10169 [Phytophthora rubi]|uniref:RxLR effector protein n=1 Tax=Phytophthora rubi TaxID=129364 RepID=A0A6A4FEH3_9STRA|nr:hypothetical protein PR001_g10150 [Phytophthora rubi]KAE9341056.1 hypothetical protein PR003_g10169 [Phytophthora rubi]